MTQMYVLNVWIRPGLVVSPRRLINLSYARPTMLIMAISIIALSTLFGLLKTRARRAMTSTKLCYDTPQLYNRLGHYIQVVAFSEANRTEKHQGRVPPNENRIIRLLPIKCVYTPLRGRQHKGAWRLRNIALWSSSAWAWRSASSSRFQR